MARDAVHDGRVRDLKEVGDERIAADLPVKGLPELVPSRHVGSLFAAPQYLAEQDAVTFRYLLCRDEEPTVTELRLDPLNPLKVVAHRGASTAFRSIPGGGSSFAILPIVCSQIETICRKRPSSGSPGAKNGRGVVGRDARA
jgi:hypothetical protein